MKNDERWTRLFAWMFTGLLSGLLISGRCHAADAGQPIVWQTPMGTFGIPLNATEALIAYDGINKEALAGFSVPVYTDPKNIIAIEVGAVAPWQTNGPTIQPLIGIGHDIAREIPFLASYDSFHINLIGRWDTDNGKAGAGVGVSYGFAGGSLSATPTSPTTTTTVPAAPPSPAVL